MPPARLASRYAPPPPCRTAVPRSMAGTLELLRPHLARELVSPEAFTGVAAVLSTLPAALSSCMYLECRLRPAEPRTDVIVRVDPCGREILAGTNPAIRLAPDVRAHPAWLRATALAVGWADPRSVLHRCVRDLWLEFDVEERVRVPVPGVFVGMMPEAHARGSAVERRSRAEAALAPLLNDGCSTPPPAALRTCLAHLPPGASVPYVGVLMSRGTDAVRVCVAGIADRGLPRYLRSVGWPGPLDVLEAGLASLALLRSGETAPDAALLHLDVTDAVLPRIGLEYLFSRREQVYGRIREARFLDFLVERGLCAPEKREALAGWPGCSVESLPHELWPSRVVRRVNHVKLVLGGRGEWEAKGYLSVSHGVRVPPQK